MSKEHTGLPNTPEEIRAFIGKSFSSLRFGQDNEQPHENDTYTLTAHDLISAFQWSDIDAPVSAEPTDDEIIDIAVEPLGIDCDRMPYGVVVFRRALLSRYSSSPVSAEPVAHRLLRRNGDGEWVHDAKHWVNGWPPPELIRDCGQNTDLYRIEVAYAAPVAAQPGLTQQTLDDVMAGIPARDAEIAALRKQIETLQAQLLSPVNVHSNMCRGIIAPITFDMLAHVLGDDAKQEWIAAQAQPLDIRPLEITDGMALAFHRAITDGSIGQQEVDEIKTGLRAAFVNVVDSLSRRDQAQQPVRAADGLPDAAIENLAKQYDCHNAPGFKGFARAVAHLAQIYAQPQPSGNAGELYTSFESWRKSELPWTSPSTTGIGFAWDAWRASAALAQQHTDMANALPQLNDDLIAILGRPNFMCAQLADTLRSGGQEIAKRAENEQAAVIHFLLGHYLADPAQWAEKASAALKAARKEPGQ